MRKHIQPDGSTFEYKECVVSMDIKSLIAVYPTTVAVSVVLDAQNKIRVVMHTAEDIENAGDEQSAGYFPTAVDDAGRVHRTLFMSPDYELDTSVETAIRMRE